MGLFDKLKDKKNTAKKAEEAETISIGWNAIEKACEAVYPTQKNRKHYGTLIKWRLGGNEPLDGIDIYDGGDFWHFVTYGLSELYEKECEDMEISGYGMEFTFKLKKSAYQDEEAELRNVCGILQSIARITFTKGEVFQAYEYLYTGQTQGIDARKQSNITGFITIPDREIKSIKTPHGSLDFVEFIGATDAELTAIRNKELNVKELYEKLGTDITAYDRASVV